MKGSTIVFSTVLLECIEGHFLADMLGLSTVLALYGCRQNSDRKGAPIKKGAA